MRASRLRLLAIAATRRTSRWHRYARRRSLLMRFCSAVDINRAARGMSRRAICNHTLWHKRSTPHHHLPKERKPSLTMLGRSGGHWARPPPPAGPPIAIPSARFFGALPKGSLRPQRAVVGAAYGRRERLVQKISVALGEVHQAARIQPLAVGAAPVARV